MCFVILVMKIFLFLAMGAVPGPFSCYLALRGVKTLHLRMREHEKNAFEVAKFLNSSPHVEKVIYPGLICTAFFFFQNVVFYHFKNE